MDDFTAFRTQVVEPKLQEVRVLNENLDPDETPFVSKYAARKILACRWA